MCNIVYIFPQTSTFIHNLILKCRNRLSAVSRPAPQQRGWCEINMEFGNLIVNKDPGFGREHCSYFTLHLRHAQHWAARVIAGAEAGSSVAPSGALLIYRCTVSWGLRPRLNSSLLRSLGCSAHVILDFEFRICRPFGAFQIFLPGCSAERFAVTSRSRPCISWRGSGGDST